MARVGAVVRGATRRWRRSPPNKAGWSPLDQLAGNVAISSRSASRRIERGSLHRIHRGVYVVGHRSVARAAQLRAALLACGEGAVISHGTAAALWGLWDKWPALIDVTVPVEAGRKIDEIRCRRCRYPQEEEITIHRGVICTTPARVFVDLAGMVGLERVRRTVERAAVRKLLDLEASYRAVHFAKGRRGLRGLTAVLDVWNTPGGKPPTCAATSRRWCCHASFRWGCRGRSATRRSSWRASA